MAFENLSEGEREELRDALATLYTFLNERIFTLRNERDEARAERDELRELVARYRAGLRETNVACSRA